MSRNKTTTQMLAEIGASHGAVPALHANFGLRRRRIFAQDGSTIGFMDCFEANAFVAAAQAAA